MEATGGLVTRKQTLEKLMIIFFKNVWAKIVTFTKKNPVWAIEIGVVLLVFGLGLMAGYKIFHKPPSIEYKDKLVEDVVSKQQLQVEKQHSADLQKQIEILTATNEDLKKHQTIVKHEVDHKDGSKTIDTTVTTDTDNKKTNTTDTKTKTEDKVVDNTKTDKVDESTLHLDHETDKKVTQQGDSPFSATASFGYMWDFSNPGAKGSMYTGLNIGYNVIWILGVEVWVFDPLNNPTKPAVGGGVYLDFAKLFGAK